jgi:ThiF family
METGTQDGLGTALSCAKRQEGWPKALGHPIRLTTMLDASELERYARHIVLREVGGPGQAKLKAARVLVVGAGGLGAPVLLYLAAAGVGTLGVVDDDTVSL